MIKLNHLDKYFFKNKKNQIHVMNDISLEFPQKGLVVLLGPSGSGKTTLLNVIGGLDKVDKGEIDFDGQVIHKYDAKAWDEIRNEKVGYIFQNYNLLPHLSVFENIAFVLRLIGIHDEEIITKNVEYILKAVGMFKYRKKKATQLSGGQQQRVAIARALVKNPEIVIADEPTGNLDSKNTIDIMKIIKEISKEKLVVLVTHEKDIAHIYGDKIIQLKDGQIIDEIDNQYQANHERIDENIVYLKDMHQVISHDEDKFKVDMYHEEKQLDEPINVKLIVRNKTLYIDVSSDFKQVKLLDDRSNLLIRDEHYKKMEQADYLNTTFDQNELDLKHVQKDKKLMISAKQILKLAFQKVLTSTKKGKLLLVSFVFSGMMIALAMALGSNFIVPNPSNMTFDNDYLVISNDEGESLPDYNVLSSYLDDDAFMNLMPTAKFSIVDEQTNSTFFDFSASVDLIDFLDDPKITEGSMATNENQIMISSALADSFFESGLLDFNPTFAQSYGIWDEEDLLKEKVIFNNEVYEISGIVKSKLALIYTSRATYYEMFEFKLGIFNQSDSVNHNYLFIYKEFEENDLLYGSLPSDDQVLVSSKTLISLDLDNYLDEAQSWPVDVPLIGLVSGVIDNEDDNFVYLSEKQITKKIYEENNFKYEDKLFIHGQDKKSLATKLESYNLSVSTESSYAIQQARYTISLSFMIPMIIIIFGASFLGFYFLMHSTMISRIYEISVYRSLGMKKLEIAMSYFVETAFMSTITSMVGYLIATFIFMQFTSSPLGLSPFVVSPLSVLLGAILVYVINIGAGMIPILLLLRHTPSEISAKFDI